MEKYLIMDECGEMKQLDVEAGLVCFVGNLKNYKNALYAALKSIKGKLPIIYGMLEYDEYNGFQSIAATLGTICNRIGAEEIRRDTYILHIAAMNDNVSFLSERLGDYICKLEELLSEITRLIRFIENEEKKGTTDLLVRPKESLVVG